MIFLTLFSLLVADNRTAKSLLRQATKFSRLAKWLLAKGESAASNRAYTAKRNLLLHAMFAAYCRFRIASDSVSMLSVGSGKHRSHFVRSSIRPFPRYENDFINTVVGMGRILSEMIANDACSTIDYLSVLDSLDNLRDFKIDLIKKRVKNALDASRKDELGAARFELDLALRATQRIIRIESGRRPNQAEAGRLRKALQTARAECQSGDLKLHTVRRVFDCIDIHMPYTTRRIYDAIGNLQLASKLARTGNKFDEAVTMLNRIEKDLLDDPSDGNDGPSPCLIPANPVPPSKDHGVKRLMTEEPKSNTEITRLIFADCPKLLVSN